MRASAARPHREAMPAWRGARRVVPSRWAPRREPRRRRPVTASLVRTAASTRAATEPKDEAERPRGPDPFHLLRPPLIHCCARSSVNMTVRTGALALLARRIGTPLLPGGI